MADFRFRPERGKQHTLRATYFDESLDINGLGFLTRNDQMNLDYNYNIFESDIEDCVRGRPPMWLPINGMSKAGPSDSVSF